MFDWLLLGLALSSYRVVPASSSLMTALGRRRPVEPAVQLLPAGDESPSLTLTRTRTT
jgi:hypothetical protein